MIQETTILNVSTERLSIWPCSRRSRPHSYSPHSVMYLTLRSYGKIFIYPSLQEQQQTCKFALDFFRIGHRFNLMYKNCNINYKIKAQHTNALIIIAEIAPLVCIGVRVTRSSVLCVCFVDRCLSFCTFSFGHCVVCSSIYGFWLPLWYLQTLLIM